MHRNGCTLRLLRDRTASPYFQSRIQLCKSNSYPLWILALNTQFSARPGSRKIKPEVQRSL